MERHQHVVVQILSHLGQVWVYASHKPELLTTSMMVFGWERPTFGDELISITSYCFQIFSRVNIKQRSVVWFFVIFRGSFGHFLCINWVFNAFMCIIQIWTTCTRFSAYKLVEKSNPRPWVHASVPCKKWEWISNTRAPSIPGKTLRCLVFKFY